MEVTEFALQGLKLVYPKVHEDHRGYFIERYKSDAFKNIGIPNTFIQDNFSYSKPNVIRGLHYQYQAPQGKLVTCLSGKIFDVAVDIRKDSPTYGQHQSVILSGDKPGWFWVPAGFAHGFYVMDDQPATVLYKVDNVYSPKGEGAIVWNDPTLNIKWPNNDPVINGKDKEASLFSEYSKAPVF